MKSKISMLTVVVVLGAALLGGILALGLWVAFDGQQVAQSYITACYQEQGGNRWICSDGGRDDCRQHGDRGRVPER